MLRGGVFAIPDGSAVSIRTGLSRFQAGGEQITPHIRTGSTQPIGMSIHTTGAAPTKPSVATPRRRRMKTSRTRAITRTPTVRITSTTEQQFQSLRFRSLEYVFAGTDKQVPALQPRLRIAQWRRLLSSIAELHVDGIS